MFERIRNRNERRRTLREIAALGERDLADIGLGRDALAHLVAVDAQVYARMDRMAALHGLTHRDLQHDRAEFAALAAICETCTAKGRCQGALDTSGTRAGDTTFCPNHEAYRRLAEGA